MSNYGTKGREQHSYLRLMLMLHPFLLNLAYSAFVALTWIALWHLNDFFFNAAKVTPLVSLIFLPAVLRPVAVLLFGVPGAIGLILGAAMTITAIGPINFSLILITLSNGLTALGSLTLMRQIPSYRCELTGDMAGLTLRTIIAFAGLTAVASTVVNSFIFSLSPTLSWTSGLSLSMLFGDAVGALLMLYLLSLLSPAISKHLR
jgi:hypothetical protein